LRTHGWALVNGDRELFKQTLFVTDDARKFAEDTLVKREEASADPNKAQYIADIRNNQYGVEDGIMMPAMAANQKNPLTGFKILSQRTASADEMTLVVEAEMASAPPAIETLNFQRFGGDWKIVINQETIRNMMGK
jgi:hypothetical protein